MESRAGKLNFALALLLASLALGAVSLTGCGGGGGGGGTRLANSFFVIDQTPATPFRFPIEGDVGFDENNAIILTFTADVDPATVLDPNSDSGTAPTIRLTTSGGTRIMAQAFLGGVDAGGNPPSNQDEMIMSDGGNILRLIADTDKDIDTIESFDVQGQGAEITVFISTAVRSMSGEALTETFCATYNLGISGSNPPPYVSSTFPTANSTGVDLMEPIVINFSEEVDPESVIGVVGAVDRPRNIALRAFNPMSGISLPPSIFTGTVQPTFKGSNCSFTFIPDAPYPAQSVLTVTVKSSVDPNNPANNGVRDLLGRPLAAAFVRPAPGPGDFVFSVITGDGPPIANNPLPPQAVFFGAINPTRFGVIGSDGFQDFNGQPFPNAILDTNNDGVADSSDDNIIAPNSENDSVGRVSAIEVGRPIIQTTDPACLLGFFIPGVGPAVGSASGGFLDAPPAPNPPAPPAINSTATCVFNVCGLLTPLPSTSNSDLGFYLYVADSDNNVIQVVNSNTSQVIDTIPVLDPTNLAMDPDMTALYVSNFGANTVSLIDTDPFSPFFHQVRINIPVGAGPRGIAVQPDGEDVVVCNSIENSVSFIDKGTNTVRKTVTSLVGPEPWEVAVTMRQTPVFPFGTGTYFAFITNRSGDSISIFESGPSAPVFFGPDNINQVITEGPAGPFERPMGIVGNRLYNGAPPTNAGQSAGALFVCNGNASVAEVKMTNFQMPPSPNFPSPGTLRTFSVVSQLDPSDPFNPIFPGPTDIAVSDAVVPCLFAPASAFQVNGKKWHLVGSVSGAGGQRVYVSTTNRVVVLDRRTFIPIAEIQVPGVGSVETFFN